MHSSFMYIFSFYAQGRVRKLAASLHAPRAASSGIKFRKISQCKNPHKKWVKNPQQIQITVRPDWQNVTTKK